MATASLQASHGGVPGCASLHSARRHALQLTWGAGSGGKVCRKWGWPLTGLKSRTNQDKPRQIKTNQPLINSNHHESGLINKKGGLPLANLVRVGAILCHFEMPLGSVALHSQPAREFSSHFAGDSSNICVIWMLVGHCRGSRG